MDPVSYEQHLRFMHLYNAALAAQEQDTRSRSPRKLIRHNSSTSLGPVNRSYPPPVRRANSSGKLEVRRKSMSRTSSESGYNSNLEHRRQSRSLDRGLTKRISTVSDSGAYEGYPQVRRVSVVRDLDNRPPTPPIIKRRGSSIRSNDSMSPSVRFSTVEDIMSAYGHGDSWSGRYKPRKSIDHESHVSAHSMDEVDGRRGRRSSSASRGFEEVDGGRRSSHSHRHERRESSSSRRASVSSRRPSVSSRRSSVTPGSRRQSTSSRVSYNDGPQMSIVNQNGLEGAEIIRRLSRASQLQEWERSLIMSRRSSKSSRRGSKSSRRRSTSSRRRSSVGATSSGSSSSDSGSDSDSDSESDSDSSSSGSGTSDSDSDSSSGSSSGSNIESDSETENSGERRLSKSANVSSKYGGTGTNAGFDSVDGGRTSQANGGMAFATDGDRDWRMRESDASSSVCVIL